jgi:hypothetical protein
MYSCISFFWDFSCYNRLIPGSSTLFLEKAGHVHPEERPRVIFTQFPEPVCSRLSIMQLVFKHGFGEEAQSWKMHFPKASVFQGKVNATL